MAMILWAMGLSLLIQGCLSSVGQTGKGCMKWSQNGEDVCCIACHPGNRLVKECGRRPEDLCTPCLSDTYLDASKNDVCTRCTQCVGAQVLEEECTATTDTKCGCKEGLTCGDERCSFCVKKCGKGQEPTEKRTCRPCPAGTFNDQTHQKCKKWSTKCPNQDQVIVNSASQFSDITCSSNNSKSTVTTKPVPDHKEDNLPVAISVVSAIVLMAPIIIIMIIIVAVKSKRDEEKKKIKETKKTPIIRTPTDDPRTLIAIECSFHEAQQEQGSSSESLASKDSSDQLIA